MHTTARKNVTDLFQHHYHMEIPWKSIVKLRKRKPEENTVSSKAGLLLPYEFLWEVPDQTQQNQPWHEDAKQAVRCTPSSFRKYQELWS